MTTHTHTHTHKVNNLDEIIAKAKEYTRQEGKWNLISNYYKHRKNNNIEVGIVIGNAKGETAEIYAEFFGPKREIYDKFSKELTDLFPIEIKPSKTDNQGKEEKESQELNQEGAKNSASAHEKGSDNKITTGFDSCWFSFWPPFVNWLTLLLFRE